MPFVWRVKMDFAAVMAVLALSLSALSFYRSYIYTKHQLDVTVTEVSYVTNEGSLYMTVAFTNAGNRDAALLRVEPALWGRREKTPEWIPLVVKVHPDIPVTAPNMPSVVKAGGCPRPWIRGGPRKPSSHRRAAPLWGSASRR